MTVADRDAHRLVGQGKSVGGYASEPEAGGYDSDAGHAGRYATLDRRRLQQQQQQQQQRARYDSSSDSSAFHRT